MLVYNPDYCVLMLAQVLPQLVAPDAAGPAPLYCTATKATLALYFKAVFSSACKLFLSIPVSMSIPEASQVVRRLLTFVVR